jgi:hypothetical protein
MFRFTIRELFLTTVIAALAVGWFVDRSNLVSELEEFRFAVDLRNQGPPPVIPEQDPSKEPNVMR